MRRGDFVKTTLILREGETCWEMLEDRIDPDYWEEVDEDVCKMVCFLQEPRWTDTARSVCFNANYIMPEEIDWSSCPAMTKKQRKTFKDGVEKVQERDAAVQIVCGTKKAPSFSL